MARRSGGKATPALRFPFHGGRGIGNQDLTAQLRHANILTVLRQRVDSWTRYEVSMVT